MRLRLILLPVSVLVLSVLAYCLVLKLMPPKPTPQQVGLLWLRGEYHIPDEAFEKIQALHRDYFTRCDAMCEKMINAHQPYFQRTPPTQKSAPPAQVSQDRLSQEKAICENCLDSMVAHLQAVAALMPEAEGKRFLKEILPEVLNPIELQSLRSQVPRSQ